MEDGRRIPFSPADEERIASAGLWGVIVAISSMASSIVGIVTAVRIMMKLSDSTGLHALTTTVSLAVAVPGAIALGISVVLAVWLLQASLAFRKVALTDVADQHYLLQGFRKLRNYFMMMGILFIVAVGGAVFMFCGSIVCRAGMR